MTVTVSDEFYATQTVDNVNVRVQRRVRDNGVVSYDVWEVDVDGTLGDCLTEGNWFDDEPSDDEIREVLPEKGDHTFTVTVSGCTALQADQVMGERCGPDADYGFDYQITWS